MVPYMFLAIIALLFFQLVPCSDGCLIMPSVARLNLPLKHRCTTALVLLAVFRLVINILAETPRSVSLCGICSWNMLLVRARVSHMPTALTFIYDMCNYFSFECT